MDDTRKNSYKAVQNEKKMQGRRAFGLKSIRFGMGYLNQKLWSVLLCIRLLCCVWACGTDTVVSFYTTSDSVLCACPSLFKLGRH